MKDIRVKNNCSLATWTSYTLARPALHEAGMQHYRVKWAPNLVSSSAGGTGGKGSTLGSLSGQTIQHSKVEVLLPVTDLAWAGENLGTYLASFPSCHTVLHFHGFNYTNFLTFWYLENKNGQKFYKHSNFATMLKSEAMKRFFVKHAEIWSKQQQQPLINTSYSKFIFEGQQRKAIPSAVIKSH